MPHKVLMLGGKRAGKSSLLSSILFSLKYGYCSSCKCEDKTYYGTGVVDLENKRRELERYINRFNTIGYNINNERPLFLVDAGVTMERGVYTLRNIIDGAERAYIDIDFIDVPGEWMEAKSSGHDDLIDEVRKSDVFIIAIDTPMLMEAPTYLSNKYNRIKAIQRVLDNLFIKDGDQKLIIFCPIKCEKWLIDGKLNDVIDMIKTSYSGIINTWQIPEVNMFIIPVQTAGGIEFVKQLPSSMLKRNNYAREELCSVDNQRQRYLLSDGTTLEFYPTINVRQDDNLNEFPLSWFQVNGVGYKPRSCEIVTLNIIRFLVNKEIKFYSQKQADKKWWQFWKPPFGKYLNSFRSFIEGVNINDNNEICINNLV